MVLESNQKSGSVSTLNSIMQQKVRCFKNNELDYFPGVCVNVNSKAFDNLPVKLQKPEKQDKENRFNMDGLEMIE